MKKVFFSLILILLSTNALAKRIKKQQVSPKVPICNQWLASSGDIVDVFLGVGDWAYMPFTPENNSKYPWHVYFWEGLVRIDFNGKGAPYVTVLKSRNGKWPPRSIEHGVPEAQEIGEKVWIYPIPQAVQKDWCIGYDYLQISRKSGRVSLHQQVLRDGSASFVLYPKERDYLHQVYIFDLNEPAYCEGKGCRFYGVVRHIQVEVIFWVLDITSFFRQTFGLATIQ